MTDQVNLPAYRKDRDNFKEIAATRKMSMKDLFHDVVEGLVKKK